MALAIRALSWRYQKMSGRSEQMNSQITAPDNLQDLKKYENQRIDPKNAKVFEDQQTEILTSAIDQGNQKASTEGFRSKHSKSHKKKSKRKTSTMKVNDEQAKAIDKQSDTDILVVDPFELDLEEFEDKPSKSTDEGSSTIKIPLKDIYDELPEDDTPLIKYQKSGIATSEDDPLKQTYKGKSKLVDMLLAPEEEGPYFVGVKNQASGIGAFKDKPSKSTYEVIVEEFSGNDTPLINYKQSTSEEDPRKQSRKLKSNEKKKQKHKHSKKERRRKPTPKTTDDEEEFDNLLEESANTEPGTSAKPKYRATVTASNKVAICKEDAFDKCEHIVLAREWEVANKNDFFNLMPTKENPRPPIPKMIIRKKWTVVEQKKF